MFGAVKNIAGGLVNWHGPAAKARIGALAGVKR